MAGSPFRVCCLRRGFVAPVAIGLVLASCAQGPKDDDEQKIATALLQTLTAQDRAPICVDSGTYGEPLAVYRTMRVAPEAVRRLLHWSQPGPLKPGRLLSDRELVHDELGNGSSRLPEFAQTDNQLPLTVQVQLNALAHAASLAIPEASTWLHNSAATPRARVRWWPLNRFDRSCGPVYTVSKPVIRRRIAFATVTAGHQGSTYAFQKKGADWTTVAQWSNWLY